jgi:hypothetical protein
MTPAEATVNAYLDEFVRRTILRRIASKIAEGYYRVKGVLRRH